MANDFVYDDPIAPSHWPSEDEWADVFDPADVAGRAAIRSLRLALGALFEGTRERSGGDSDLLHLAEAHVAPGPGLDVGVAGDDFAPPTWQDSSRRPVARVRARFAIGGPALHLDKLRNGICRRPR